MCHFSSHIIIFSFLKIEESINDLDGIKRVESDSFESAAVMWIEPQDGVDLRWDRVARGGKSCARGEKAAPRGAQTAPEGRFTRTYIGNSGAPSTLSRTRDLFFQRDKEESVE